jgi:hypothetical protein
MTDRLAQMMETVEGPANQVLTLVQSLNAAVAEANAAGLRVTLEVERISHSSIGGRLGQLQVPGQLHRVTVDMSLPLPTAR